MFDWDDYLVLAEDLAARSGDEAAARSAISRAYYATFHAGRDYLIDANIPIDRGRNAHFQVQEQLRRMSILIGYNVERLHVWRKQADYEELSFPDVGAQAAIAVDLARDTIDQIRAIR